MEWENMFAGIGGQGILVSSLLLSEAANNEGKRVLQYANYAGVVTGGPCECTVILGTEEIESPPLVTSFCGVVAMHADAARLYQPQIRPGGLFLVNTSVVVPTSYRNDVTIVELPASKLAEEMGSVRAANMVALGAFVQFTGLVSLDSVLQGLEKVIPPHRRDIMPVNQRALARGSDFIKQGKGIRRNGRSPFPAG